MECPLILNLTPDRNDIHYLLLGPVAVSFVQGTVLIRPRGHGGGSMDDCVGIQRSWINPRLLVVPTRVSVWECRFWMVPIGLEGSQELVLFRGCGLQCWSQVGDLYWLWLLELWFCACV